MILDTLARYGLRPWRNDSWVGVLVWQPWALAYVSRYTNSCVYFDVM